MNNDYPKSFKSPTHKRAVAILGALSPKAGLSVRSTKQSVIDYLLTLIEENNKRPQMPEEVKVLKYLPDLEEVAYKLGSFLNFSINNSLTLTRTCDLLGKSVLSKYESAKTNKEELHITRVKVGLELLDLLRVDKKISFRKEPLELDPDLTDKQIEKLKGRRTWKIKVRDEDFAFKLGLSFFYIDKDVQIFTQPLLKEPADWKGFHHPLLGELVRNSVEGTAREFSIQKTPKVFEFMNHIKSTSFQVNTDLLAVFNECIPIHDADGNLIQEGDPIFNLSQKDLSPVQRASIMRQQNEIFKIARSLGGQEFWLGSFLDFRGRFYYSNTYFHPQGNATARGLIQFNSKYAKVVDQRAYNYFLICAASESGKDKWSEAKKLEHGREKEEEWIKWAKDPLSHKGIKVYKDNKPVVVEEGWQTVDNPQGFLPLIMELAKAKEEGIGVYKSSQPLYSDASNSGTQILSAMGKDPVGGKLSNLTSSEERGDVYDFVASKVWPTYKSTQFDRDNYNEVERELAAFQDKMDLAYKEKRWEDLATLRSKYSEHYTANKERIKACSKVFWERLEIFKRKLCKRPVMTIPYSAGPRTIARSLFSDWSPEPEMKGITGTYCFELAFDITDAYARELNIPTVLMNLFIEMGYKKYKEKEDLKLKMPESGFVFIQNARKDKMKMVHMNRKGQRLRLKVCVGPSAKIDRDAVGSGSSANTIHALDASFMVAVVLTSKNKIKSEDRYPMMVVHDSFGTIPAHFGDINKDLREQFVEMFSKDVLHFLLLQVGMGDHNETVERGNLNIEEVLTNEYAFAP